MEALLIAFGGIALVLALFFVFRKKGGSGGGRPDKFDDNERMR